ncbi:alpha/beta fold hydrolase [Thermomonospora cellulosilytica]|uniref:Pimeloyl-ACP methyl ester carboxylesterase n=1 Tax=Thermomonospora cellulosilytica TaxID=1411118 RepID=A0A7W3MU74_9ACTN|nr:alpha/beta hydrolase [Thermomonospora cellulosilytica]MBA9001938.1 pimeloyl-ACP methyl ester carboxylesterase [Thermomonospora cellulosilytica]
MKTYEHTVNGIRTVVREHGDSRDGEAVVFVHGNPGSGADWEGLLVRAGRHTRAVAWDAPGFGRADKPRDFPQNVDGHARFLGAMLDDLGVRKAHLCLHDFGGPWGLEWAVRHPERLAGLVLMDTGVLLGYRWHILARVWRTPVLGEAFMATATRRAFHLLVGKRGNPRGLPRSFVDRMFDDFDAATRRAVLRLYRSFDDPAGWSAAVSPALRALDVPVLAVWGARDPYIGAAQALIQRATFPDAEILVLPDSGHWPFIDNPDKVAEATTAFWSEHITS